MYLLPGLPNMIIDSVTRWVAIRWLGGYMIGARLVGGSVVRGFNKTQEKTYLEW